MNITIKFTPNDKGNPPGKLADAELHFHGGDLDGLKLIGFAIWERRTGGGRNVTLTDNAFSEGELTIAVGDTVTFRNAGSNPHTVTEGSNGAEAEGSSFNEQVAPGDEVEITFDEAGTFDVTCLFHGNMNMTVVVEG